LEHQKLKRVFTLDFALLQNWIREFQDLEVEEVHLAGAGDPLVHPQIIPILKNLKDAGLRVNLNTALYPLPENFAENLVEQKVDLLTASIWAGSEEEWIRMHPGVDRKAFGEIENFLQALHAWKKKKKSLLPRLKMYHVITSQNFCALEKMVEFGIRHYADEVEFQSVDLIPGATEHLKLTPAMVQKVLEQLKSLRARQDYTEEFIGPNNRLDLDSTEPNQERKEFGRFYKPLKEGFYLIPETHRVHCPREQEQVKRVWIHDHPYPAHAYEFDVKICTQCDRGSLCYETPKSLPLEISYLNLKGVGSFLRRIQAHLEDDCKEAKLVNKIPCTVGWTYGRILANGQYVPCCKAANFPLGDLSKQSFSSIWFGVSLNEFREKAKTLRKDNPYFSKIQCLKGCDNLGMNLETIEKGLTQ
jgi:MoaA/NifB/PqqE/SkfB family radical SAM enzyme